MDQILIRIYHYFKSHRLVFFAVFAASFLLLGYFAMQVRFEEDIAKILPKDKKIEKLNEVFQNSKFMDKLVVTVSLKDTSTTSQPDSLVEYADLLVEHIQTELSGYVKKVQAKVDEEVAMELYQNISAHLPIYLNESDYQTIDSLIAPPRVKQTLEQNVRTLTSPAGLALKNIIINDPVGISMVGFKKLQQLQYDENFELYDNYVVTKDFKHLLFFIEPAYPPNNTGKNAVLLQRLDSIIGNIATVGYENIQTSYFGATAVSVGNALQLRQDSMLTQGITVLFIIVFLGVYFRKKRAPFIILIPVLLGALFSLAAIYFIKGSISVIALGTGSVVLGIAVNYSLHVFNHYRHTPNMPQLLKDLALPMTVGSFTTIGGFFCLEFVESEMLKDLGLFAGFSLIGASVCSLIFLPQLIASKNETEHTTSRSLTFIDALASFRPEYNKYLVLLILAGTAFFAFWSNKVGFESDLGKMNFMSPKLQQAERQLNSINQYAMQSVYLVAEGNNLNEALANNEKLVGTIQRLEAQGQVKKYSGVSSLIISEGLQRQRIQQWNAYWTPEKKQALMATLQQEGAALKYSATAFDLFKGLLYKEYTIADTATTALVRKNFLDDYITEKPGKATVVTLVKVAPNQKGAIYQAFDNEPHITVLDKQYLAVRLVQIVKDDFSSIALMTSVLVFLVLLIMYGRIELTLVSFIPMFITWVWILGIMGVAGIQFNIINIIVSALIFGLGDDYSLFIMDGLLQEYKTGKKNLSSFKSSIILSAITTIAGLGVLIFAKHPALRSIATISIIGILSVVLMSQILIPFFFNMLIRDRVTRKLFPWTFSNFLKSAFAFSIFISVSILFTVVGRIFAAFGVKERGKLLYHQLLAKSCWFLMYVMGNVKKQILNPLNEDLSKPAIIICNHQSSLDIVPLIMLHPKILMFTNAKKWNAAFFGPVIRMADYFPAEEMEQNIERIADRMRKGYSIIIFPEGTRSEDGVIDRFHKGAFYLAEKLQADILPILIHGTNYTLTKKDALLKDGQVTLQYLPRISATNTEYGVSYAERAKGIGKYCRTSFETLRSQIEQPAYFREKLIYNYIYKGPVIEWYMRIKTRLEKNYIPFNNLIPKEGKILDIGCGYGFLAYMLHFTSGARHITGIDYDEEKIAVANNCISKTDQLRFIHGDIQQFDFDQYNGIIIADVLHYLLPPQQLQLLQKCIQHLQPGGTLIIREGDSDKIAQHKKTTLSEYCSTRLFGFNKTATDKLSFVAGSFVRQLAAAHQLECTEIQDSMITSNTIFVLKKKCEA